MTNARRWVVAGLLALLAASSGACATTQGPASGSTSSRDHVTHEELAATNSQMVYQALERLRPNWLTSRGPANIGNVTDSQQAVANVYINGNRMGNVEYLKQVYVNDVQEIRFWGSGDATARFGMGNPRGVIEIISRR